MTTDKRPDPRRPYATPEVTVHGDVKAVTANVGNMSPRADNSGNPPMHKTF